MAVMKIYSSKEKIGGKFMANDKLIITKTNDGYVVEIFAKVKSNIEDGAEEVAEGISVLESNKTKTEEEQFSIYKEIVEKMDEKPVIIKAFEKEKDINILKIQLRAILRAAKSGNLSIAFSKISSTIELIDLKEILEECKKELEAEGLEYKKHIKIGVIVEIPSSALMSYEIARECDFLFIETDSLTEYTFCGKLNHIQKQQFQLGIVRLIRLASKGAHDAGIFCGVCGDIAQNELYIPLLIGLGIDEFSIDIKNIESVRKLINRLDRSDCKELAEEILQMRTIEDIEIKLKQFARD